MANILFIDDSPEIYNVAFSVLQSTHDNLNIYLSSNVRSTIRLLCDIEFDLVIMDVFIPIGENAEDTLGTRAKMYEGEYQHLGGLELLDFFSRMDNKPKILLHTACFDYNVISLFTEFVDDRLRKPASIDVFIDSVKEALNI
jgi:CheY-like chemotaxis protein|tara:strand:+ start:88 stop:513 length:426 start_codon:yes stop_codon:yes gene_type:complete